MKLISLKIKNYKKFKETNFSFNNNNEKNVSHITGGNASGKTTFLDAMLWCLYEYKRDNEIIPNKNEIPTEVRVEILVEDNSTQYQISRTQKYSLLDDYDNSILEIKCDNNEASSLFTGEEAQKIINDIFPEYIVKYQICKTYEYEISHLWRKDILPNALTKFAKDIDITSTEILKLLNKYANNFFINKLDVKLELFIDDDFNFHIIKTDDNKDFIAYAGNTEFGMCCALALVFAMIKIFEKLKNSNIFIVLEDPSNYFNHEVRKKFKKMLISNFSQVILLSDKFKEQVCSYSDKEVLNHISDTYNL